jgi:hypothetical protein
LTYIATDAAIIDDAALTITGIDIDINAEFETDALRNMFQQYQRAHCKTVTKYLLCYTRNVTTRE